MTESTYKREELSEFQSDDFMDFFPSHATTRQYVGVGESRNLFTMNVRRFHSLSVRRVFFAESSKLLTLSSLFGGSSELKTKSNINNSNMKINVSDAMTGTHAFLLCYRSSILPAAAQLSMH